MIVRRASRSAPILRGKTTGSHRNSYHVARHPLHPLSPDVIVTRRHTIRAPVVLQLSRMKAEPGAQVAGHKNSVRLYGRAF